MKGLNGFIFWNRKGLRKMAKKPTVPIKITAKLKDGRINSNDGIIMFDSILYHAWFCKHAPQVLMGENDPEYSGYIGLPLRQLPGNRWAASKGIYKEIGQSIDHINKRPNFFVPDKIGYLDMEKGLISESVGEYRAYRVPQMIRVVKDGIIEFWAVGHPEGITDLLNSIRTIGKKAAIGYGNVESWTVEECKKDYSLWHPEYGLMRPVEVGSEESEKLNLNGYPVMQYAVKPPYWKVKNERLCYVPIR